MKNMINSKPALAILSVFFTLMIANVQAADLVQFSNGNIADADDVNANFNELETRIETISLTPGPAGADSTVAGPQGPAGAVGPAGADAVLPVGADPGDLFYWDGSVWQLTLAPPVTAWIKDPSLHLCNGVPTWSSSGCTVYAIGDKGPAGGFVFYVINGGHSGLEAAPEDIVVEPNNLLFCDDPIPDAYFTAIGSGQSNTRAILRVCYGGSMAAVLADRYSLNGFSDWFLPSRDELNEMYLQQSLMFYFGPILVDDGSKTQYLDPFRTSSSVYCCTNQPWKQNFDDGTFELGTMVEVGVRAVRAF